MPATFFPSILQTFLLTCTDEDRWTHSGEQQDILGCDHNKYKWGNKTHWPGYKTRWRCTASAPNPVCSICTTARFRIWTGRTDQQHLPPKPTVLMYLVCLWELLGASSKMKSIRITVWRTESLSFKSGNRGSTRRPQSLTKLCTESQVLGVLALSRRNTLSRYAFDLCSGN